MRRDRSLTLAVEVGLASVTLAAVLGMSRLFAGAGWLLPLTTNAIVAHLTVTVARRRGLSLGASAAVTTISALVVATWTIYGGTTTYGIPTADTLSVMRSDLNQAWGLYQHVVAPTPVEEGFVFASAIAVWVVAYVADWAAFRLWVPFEATLPAGTLFLFTALLGAPRGRGWAVALFAGTLLGFLLLHRTTRQDGTAPWVGDRRVEGNRSVLSVGMLLGVVAVVSGTVLGPLLPGADAPGVLDPRGADGDGTRVTISPLVDIRSRLVDQSNIEVFTVQSPEPAYWRLTSLDRFDGRIWSSSGSYEQASGSLPASTEAHLRSETFDQRFRIEALAAIWLPGAYEVRAIDVDGAKVLYEPRSSTLIVDRDNETSDDLSYRVTSSSPRITAADLRGSGGAVPDTINAHYLELPADFSPAVQRLAEDLVAGAPTPYAAARALQDHLRSFTYDLAVQAGHSGDALETFLFETQRGYCEQFAGAFAAMARAIGLPARVAVGFTQGERDAIDPELFRVRGEHAHAWPEVFLAGTGWVSFEPTPGRGQPFAEDYTGVPAAQAGPADPTTVTTNPLTADTSPGATLPDTSGARPSRDDELNTAPSAGGGSSTDTLVTRLVTRPLRMVVGLIAILLVAHLALFPTALLVGHRRRRRRARTPLERVSLAWTEASEAAAMLGHRELRSDTLEERADRLTSVVPNGGDAARELTHRAQIALYSAEGADHLDAELAEEAGATIRELVRSSATLTARIRPWIDPRPTVRAWRQHHRGMQRVTAALRASRPSEAGRVRSLVRR
ncbi:MAG: DUF3488 and transglutaminase-like domain-containing protein [Acidimicrobiales bacterium]